MRGYILFNTAGLGYLKWEIGASVPTKPNPDYDEAYEKKMFEKKSIKH